MFAALLIGLITTSLSLAEARRQEAEARLQKTEAGRQEEIAIRQRDQAEEARRIADTLREEAKNAEKSGAVLAELEDGNEPYFTAHSPTADVLAVGATNGYAKEETSFGSGGPAVEFSSDSAYIITAEADGVTAWDVNTGTKTNEFKTLPESGVLWLRAHPTEPNRVALPTRGSGTWIWDFSTPSPKLEGYTDVKFSPDGKWLAARNPGNFIVVLDVESMKEINRLCKYSATGSPRR